MTIGFAYNPTSWNKGPIPGGMADCLVQPILPHLTSRFELTNKPEPGRVNVYYSHRAKGYGIHSKLPGETAVFVSHGIADKAWRNKRKLAGHYDFVFVSGPAWTRRMVVDGMRPDQIIEVGYTKLDPIFNRQVPSEWGERDGRVRVVYAPTHGGGGEKFAQATAPHSTGSQRTSHWNRDLILSQLDDRFDVKVALHPRHRTDKRSTLAEYVDADVVIGDGGSTIYEAWSLDLPVVFPSWLTAAANIRKSRPAEPTFEGHIYKDRLGYHADSPGDLAERVLEAADQGIRPVDQAFIETIFPAAYRGVSGRLHAEALDDITNRVKVRHSAMVELVTYEHTVSGVRRKIPNIGPRARKYEQSGRWRKVVKE